MSSSNNFDVKIRMSTVGSDQLRAELRAIADEMARIGNVSPNATGGMRGLTGAVFEGNIAATVFTKTFSLVGDAVGAVADQLRSFISDGIKFNSTMELSRVGLASIVLTYNDAYNAQGKLLTGQDALNAGLLYGAEVQKKIQGAVFDTTATLQQMTLGYQKLLGAASGQKATTDELVKFTTSVSNMAAGLQVPFDQAYRQMALFVAGAGRASGQIGISLRNMGISNETVRSWREQGTAIEEIQKRLELFNKFGKEIRDSWTGTVSNMQDVWQQFGGAMAEPIMEVAKTQMQEIIGLFVDFSGENAKLRPEVVETFREWGDAAAGVLEALGLAVTQVFTGVDGVVRTSGLTWTEIVQGFALTFVDILGSIRTGVATAFIVMDDPVQAWVDRSSIRITGLIQSLTPLAKFLSKDLGDAFVQSSNRLIMDVSAPGSSVMKVLEVAKRIADETEAIKARILGQGPTELKEPWDRYGAMRAKDPAESDKAKKALEKHQLALDAYYVHIARAREEDERDLERSLNTEQAMRDSAVLLQDKMQQELVGLEEKSTSQRLDAQEKAHEKTIDLWGKEIAALKIAYAEKLALGKQADDIAASMREHDARNRAIYNAAQVGDVRALWREISSVVATSVSQLRAQYQRAARELLDALHPDDATAAGVAAGWFQILAQVPTVAESAAEATKETWSSMVRTADDVFFNVMSFKFSELGNVAKSFSDGMLRNFSKSITDMLERFVKFDKEMELSGQTKALPPGQTFVSGGNGWQPTPAQGPGGPGLSGKQYVSTGFAAAAAGFGSATGGAASFGQGFSPYLSAAAFAAQFNVWVAAAIAAIGLIVNLIADSTEQLRRLVGAGAMTPELAGVYRSADKTKSNLVDLYASTGETDRADFAKQMNRIITDYLRGISFAARAGSGGDLAADMDKIVTGIIPSEMMHLLFGQKIVGANKDYAGITGGSVFSSIIGADAPIPKMLAGIGFTAAKIQEIAKQIDLRDPEKFAEYLKNLVGVVVTGRNLVDLMGKTREQIYADQDATTKASPATAFAASATDLIEKIGELTMYTGDEEVAKMAEVEKAIADRYAAELQEIYAIRAARDQESASIKAQQQSMKDWHLTGAQQLANDRHTIDETWGMIINSTSAPEAIAAAERSRAAIDRIFQTLKAQILAGEAEIISLNALAAQFGMSREQLLDRHTFTPDSYQASGMTIANDIMNAAHLSGQAQIDEIHRVDTTAAGLWQSMQAALQQIDQQAKDLVTSFAKQQEGWKTSIMSPEDRAQFYLDQAQKDEGLISSAKTPEEVKRLTDEIAADFDKYFSYFNDTNDPDHSKRNAAIANMTLEEDHAQQLALDAYARMQTQIEDTNKIIQDSLKAGAKMITDSDATAASAIDDLGIILDGLDTLLTDKLNKLVDDIINTNWDLNKQFQTSMTLFTDALGTPDTGATGAADGINVAHRRAAQSANNFADALDRATGKLGGVITPSGTPPPTGTGGGGGTRTTGAAGPAVVNFIRNLGPQAFMRRTGA